MAKSTRPLSLLPDVTGPFVDGTSPVMGPDGKFLPVDLAAFVAAHAPALDLTPYARKDGATFTGNASFNAGRDVRFNGASDSNWRMGIVSAVTPITLGLATSLQVVIGAGTVGPDGFLVGNADGLPIMELRGDNRAAYFAGAATFNGNIVVPSITLNGVQRTAWAADTLNDVTARGATTTNAITASNFVGSGTSLTGITASQVNALALSGGTLTGNLSGGTNTITAQSFIGSGTSLTGITSTDTLATVTARGATTTNDVTLGNVTLAAGKTLQTAGCTLPSENYSAANFTAGVVVGSLLYTNVGQRAFIVASDVPLKWGSSSVYSGTDTDVHRVSPGVVGIGDGAGGYGDLNVGNVTLGAGKTLGVSASGTLDLHHTIGTEADLLRCVRNDGSVDGRIFAESGLFGHADFRTFTSIGLGYWSGSDFRVASGGHYAFTRNANSAQDILDTDIHRVSAGVIGIGDGAGGYGDLNVGNVTLAAGKRITVADIEVRSGGGDGLGSWLGSNISGGAFRPFNIISGLTEIITDHRYAGLAIINDNGGYGNLVAGGATFGGQVGIGGAVSGDTHYVLRLVNPNPASYSHTGLLVEATATGAAAFLTVQDTTVQARLQTNSVNGYAFFGTISNHPMKVIVNNTASFVFGTEGSFSATGAVTTGVITLTYASTIAINAKLGNQFNVTLTGDVTFLNPTNPTDGQGITFLIKQDGTGGHNVSWDTSYDDVGGVAAAMLKTPNKGEYISVIYDVGSGKWRVMPGLGIAYAN